MKKLYISLICLVAMAGLIGLSGCGKEQTSLKKGGSLVVKSTPAGADVIVIGKNRGVTPLTMKNVRARSYIVKIIKPGYQIAWRRIDVQVGKKFPLNVALTPIQASVLLVSNPNHVKIYLDNKLRGETPLLIKRLPLGKYSARIEKQGFSTREISWTIENAKPRKVTISLISNVATITIDSTPEECQVFINEQARGVTPLSLILEEGKYKIRLKKSGFSPLEESITVTRNKENTKHYTLKQLPGALSITTIPADATIYINNRSCGNSPVEVDGLPAGKYTIRVVKNNFDVQKVILTVDAGRTTSKLFTLSRNTGGMDLIVNPPGTTIYINGKEYGMTVVDDDGINSKMIRIRNLKAGTYQVKIAHKRGNPTSRTYTIEVEKGKIFRHPKPAYLWVPNSELRLTGGRTFRGILVYKSKDGSKIMFSPEPGIKQEFKRSEVISLKLINDDDE